MMPQIQMTNEQFALWIATQTIGRWQIRTRKAASFLELKPRIGADILI